MAAKKPAKKPAKPPAAKPATKPAAKPAGKPAVKKAAKPVAKAAPKPVAAAGGPATTPSVPAPANTKIALVRNGPFMAQIAALRSEDAANAEWTKVSRLAPDLFANAQKDIQKADLGAKGVFYRLRAGSFASRDAAEAANRHPGVTWRVTEPLGLSDGVVEALLERVAAAENKR